MAMATMTSKGQVTIPKSVRDEMRLKAGDRLEFHVDSIGSARFETHNVAVEDLAGSLVRSRKFKRPASLAEMDAAIGKAVGARNNRSLKPR